MSSIFIIIAVIIITIMVLAWHLVGEMSEGVLLTNVIGICIVCVAGLIPFYNYEGNVSLTDYKVSKTTFGYVAKIDGTIYSNVDYEEIADSDPKNFRVVDKKNKCGLGLYTSSNYHIVDITKSPWKEELEASK